MGAFVKLGGDIPSFEKAFFRNLVSLSISIYIILKTKQNFWGKKENRIYLWGRGIFGTVGLLAYFYGIDRLLLADSGMLNKINPFFVILFAAIFLKDKITRYQIYSFFTAMLGVVFIIKPSLAFQDSLPAVICLMSAVFAGIAYVFVSYLGDKENAYVIVFYFSFISTLISGLLTIPQFVMPDFKQLVFLILAGITAALGQFTLTYAYKYAPAGEVSIYNYSNVIFSSVLGVLIFSEIPDLFSFIGYGFIITAGYLIFKFGKEKEV